WYYSFVIFIALLCAGQGSMMHAFVSTVTVEYVFRLRAAIAGVDGYNCFSALKFFLVEDRFSFGSPKPAHRAVNSACRSARRRAAGKSGQHSTSHHRTHARNCRKRERSQHTTDDRSGRRAFGSALCVMCAFGISDHSAG